MRFRKKISISRNLSMIHKAIRRKNDPAWFQISERITSDPRGIDIFFGILCRDINIEPPPDLAAKVLARLPK